MCADAVQGRLLPSWGIEYQPPYGPKGGVVSVWMWMLPLLVSVVSEKICLSMGIKAKKTRIRQSIAFCRFSVYPSENTHAKNRKTSTQHDQHVSFPRMSGNGVSRSLSENGLPATQGRARVMRATEDADLKHLEAATSRDLLENRILRWRRITHATELHRIAYLAERRTFDAVVN